MTQEEQVIAEDSEGNCYGFDSWEEVYLKDEVDAAIAELKQKLEDAGMRERRLRRALYKALANWAHFAVAFFSSFQTKDKWHKMEHICLKKAEENK